MPRYRKLYVKSVESHDINDMPDDFTRLFWLLLPLGLCREGRGLDNASWIKAKLFPMRLDVTPEKINTVMQWFDERGMIRRYVVDGRPYFCIPNGTWHKYQGTTVREAETEYPPPPDETPPDSQPTQDPLTTNSGSDAVCSMQYSDADSEVDVDPPAQAQDGSPHPAIGLYLQLTGEKEVPKGSWTARIQEVVGLDPARLNQWGRVIDDWIGKGWRPDNVSGLLDCYQRGGIGKNKHKTQDDHTSKEARRRYVSDLTMPIEVEDGVPP